MFIIKYLLHIIFLTSVNFFYANTHRLKRNVNIFKDSIQNSKIHDSELIKDVKDLFVCGTYVCEKVQEFEISLNNSFSCFEEYLAIDYFLKSANITLHGYLKSGYRARVLDNQLYTKTCNKFKKYYLIFFNSINNIIFRSEFINLKNS